MKRWMIVYALPLGVWMDIFNYPWIDRQKFGQIVDVIGNRKFSEHVQFYLHDWGKREITGELCFDEKGLSKTNSRLDGGWWKFSTINLDVPQTPLPANIKSFECIQIIHFDTNTLDFLGNIRPLLAGVAIDVSEVHFSRSTDALENLRTILTILAPMMDGIQSLECNERTLPMAKQCFGEVKFAKARVLKYHHHGGDDLQNVNLVVDWLAQPDGPRLFEARLFSEHGIFEQILQAVRQQFLTAKTPRTFAMNLHTFFEISTLQSAEFHLKNGIAEELHGAFIGPNPRNPKEGTFQIIRHRANCNKEGLQEWFKESTKGKKHRQIQLYCDNLFNNVDAPPPPMDEKKQAEQQQQPCSSKQA